MKPRHLFQDTVPQHALSVVLGQQLHQRGTEVDSLRCVLRVRSDQVLEDDGRHVGCHAGVGEGLDVVASERGQDAEDQLADARDRRLEGEAEERDQPFPNSRKMDFAW